MIEFKQTTKAKKGDLVQIHLIVLEPGERAANLPEETKTVPYEGWIKGFLLDDQAEIGQEICIETYIGRQLSGVLTEINPVYDHNFGKPQPDINFIGKQAWKKLEGEE
jgi:hypothetical protein